MREAQNSSQEVSGKIGESAESIGRRLKNVIEKLPNDGVTLAEIRDLLGQEGLILLILFLSVVFLIPVSVPGVSTVFGAAILMIALSRLLNRQLWLPRRFIDRKLPTEKLCVSLNKGANLLCRLECVSRPYRLEWLVSGRYVGTLNNCALVLGAALLMAPFGLIPLSNTLPALAILFLALGFLQRDGICILFGHIANVVTVVYFGLLLGGSGFAALRIMQGME